MNVVFTKEDLVVYVRKKSKKDGNDYHQVIENRRVDGKPRQRVIMHLGNHATVEEALKGWPREVGNLRRGGYEDAAEGLKTKLERLRKMRGEGLL
jgi:hypothetical protein